MTSPVVKTAVRFKVAEQTARGAKFCAKTFCVAELRTAGVLGVDKDSISVRNMVLRSAVCPEFVEEADDGPTVFVRGGDTSGDNDVVECPLKLWPDVLRALVAYNRIHSNNKLEPADLPAFLIGCAPENIKTAAPFFKDMG